ncbi:MAG TPA: transglutaminase [Desulfovibrio sp.]|nr:transglutaminase [Desulfovibrio sp.]
MLLNKSYLRIIISILLSLLLCSCSTKKHAAQPSPYFNSIQNILDTSGNNRSGLETFISRYTDSPEKRQAAQFLIANLPPSDRAGLSTEELAENLDYAFLARESTPWGMNVAWSDFLHYVLPHRVSQEKAVSWRKEFYTEILPLVASCKSMKEAVLTVNRWCFSKTGFKSTQRWDQNPLMTINRGWGRCEEAVILTVSALRSVGIPARQAMVPAWQHSDDNHTWTEVQVDGKWHYIESANPDYGLDHAWFSGSVRKAPLVISYAYGDAKSADFPILGKAFGCTLINTTARYAPASKTEIQLTDSSGTPVPDAGVFFSVLNYATFRPVAGKTTDSEGKAVITLGPGSILISAAQNKTSAYIGSIWIPGEQAQRPPVMLRLQKDNKPEGTVNFRFAYKDALNIPTPPKNSEGAKKVKFDSIKNARLQKLTGMKKTAGKYAPQHASAIAKAGLNTPQILKAINTCPVAHRKSLLDLISIMPPADLLTTKAEVLISHALLSDQARKQAESVGLRYSDDIFIQYVLNPRVMYEQPSNWRPLFHKKFNFNKSQKMQRLLRQLGNINAGISIIRRGPLGDSLSPEEVLHTRTSSLASEICIFNTAALRSAGVPARYLDEQGWVEFHDGDSWQPFYPQFLDKVGNKNAVKESTAYYSQWQSISFKLPHFDKKKRAPQYFKDFTISGLTGDGRFQPIEKTVEGRMDIKNKSWKISIPRGEYYLITVQRNAHSEPTISVHEIGK